MVLTTATKEPLKLRESLQEAKFLEDARGGRATKRKEKSNERGEKFSP